MIDGGSIDKSLEIVRKYVQFVEVVTEPDKGQADAIRKGFEILDTELVGWLNSDDRLLPNSLNIIARTENEFPEAVLYHGDVEIIDYFGRFVELTKSQDLEMDRLRRGQSKVLQPGSFYRRDVVMEIGNVDYLWDLLMDVDLWIRLMQVGSSRRIDFSLAQFRVHPGAKSSRLPLGYYREKIKLVMRYESDQILTAILRRLWQIHQHLLKTVIQRIWKKNYLKKSKEVPVIKIEENFEIPVELQKLSERGFCKILYFSPSKIFDVQIITKCGIINKHKKFIKTYNKDIWLIDEQFIDWTELIKNSGSPAFVLTIKENIPAAQCAGIPMHRIAIYTECGAFEQAIKTVLGSCPEISCNFD